MGLGVAMLAVPDALPYLEAGTLVRLVSSGTPLPDRFSSITRAASFCRQRRVHSLTTFCRVSAARILRTGLRVAPAKAGVDPIFTQPHRAAAVIHSYHRRPPDWSLF
jgi:hypothetical protein